MLKSIKREFLLNRNSLWQSLAVLGGAWLLGEALSLCIMYFAHEEEYFSLGTVFAAIMLVMFGVIFALYFLLRLRAGADDELYTAPFSVWDVRHRVPAAAVPRRRHSGFDAAGPRAVSAAFPRHAH